MRVVFLVLLGALVGCGEPVAKKSGNSTPPQGPAPKDAEVGPVADSYFYNPAGKRDPFQNFVRANTRGPEVVGPDTPALQRWDVEKFVLSGVIDDPNTPMALVVDPEGMEHIVRPGATVGRNWGKITSISEAGVTVSEEYQTLEGALVVNPIQIAFATSEKNR
jgi:type IV pilus assembly protein PilP